MNSLKIIKSFPSDFIFGTATSSYQIEGRQYGGCGLSHWDTFAKKPGATFKGQDGGVACAHIINLNKDLDLIKECGFSAYRFSFSWPRLLPEGKGNINNKGISFYDRLIDGLLERGLLPFATLYHWDLPQIIAESGGWQNRDTPSWFSDFTNLIMKNFGDRLYSIATINEPWCSSWLSHYWGEHAPGLKSLDATVKSMHYILLAHAKSMEVMRGYNHKNLGIVLNKTYVQPINDQKENIISAQLYNDIHNLWFDEAVFKGNYPESVLKVFNEYMPKNYQEDLKHISQRIDWLGINYYTRSIIETDPSEKNIKLKIVKGDLPKTDMGWEIFPEGISLLLNDLVKNYTKNLPLHITENGMANNDLVNNDRIDDQERINFYAKHFQELLNLLNDGIPLKSYFAWSLLDNFEWSYGYNKRFGLVHVNFESQVRTPKASWFEFKKYLVT